MRVLSLKICGRTSVQIHYNFITAYIWQRFNPNEITPLLSIEKLHRGSNISAHDLLNLLNKLVNKFNKFNNARTRMLDSIYHMTLRLL